MRKKKTLYPKYLGIKISLEENDALQQISAKNGLQPSSYVRFVLHNHLAALGAMRPTNPAQGATI